MPVGCATAWASRRRRAGAALAVFTALLAAEAATGAGAPAQAERGAGLGLKRVGGFDQPTYVHGPKGAGRTLFVVEREGRIKAVRGGRDRGTFLDIRGRVRCCDGERGMFSVAFRNYARSRLFYVYFTDGQGDLRIEEFRIRRRGVRPRARAGSGRRVLEIPHRQASNHNGGQLQFGPDGKLYIATGDGGAEPESAQRKDSLLGKLLRINPGKRGSRAYTVPRGNPYKGDVPGKGEIWSRGLRNPYRFSFDRGRIAIGDVGQNSWEEVDFETRKGAKRANFGWPRYEGFARFQGSALRKHEKPIDVYSHGGGRCAITGGYVVRDRDLGALRGRYVYGDLCTGEIRSLRPRLGGARRDRATGLPSRSPLLSFGEDARRNVYVVAGGSVYRIVRR